MAISRAQLEQMLDMLDDSIPRLVQNKSTPADFWASFTSMAQAIQERAPPEQRAWACERLDAIQVKHQLVPPPDQI